MLLLAVLMALACTVAQAAGWKELHTDVGVRVEFDWGPAPAAGKAAFVARLKAQVAGAANRTAAATAGDGDGDVPNSSSTSTGGTSDNSTGAGTAASLLQHVRDAVAAASPPPPSGAEGTAGRWRRRLYTGTATNDGSGLTRSEKRSLLDDHNDYRSTVAQGNTPNQPAAKNMNALFWDDALAAVAQAYAERCIWAHNTDPDGDYVAVASTTVTPSFGYDSDQLTIGENLYVWSDDELLLDGTIDSEDFFLSGVTAWYNEHPGYTLATDSCDTSAIAEDTCGHYTQLVWADTRYVGCGVALCPGMTNLEGQGYDNAVMLACNYYNAGNWQGVGPYETGTACSDCPSDRVQCEDGLCAGCQAYWEGGFCSDHFSNCAEEAASCPWTGCTLSNTNQFCTGCRDTCSTCSAGMKNSPEECTDGLGRDVTGGNGGDVIGSSFASGAGRGGAVSGAAAALAAALAIAAATARR